MIRKPRHKDHTKCEVPLKARIQEDVERDAKLVMAGMIGGFEAVCMCAMQLGMKGGPDQVVLHSRWMKKNKNYMKKVVKRVEEKLNERR